MVNTLPNAPQAVANSVAVALATDHAPVPVSQSGAWSVAISGAAAVVASSSLGSSLIIRASPGSLVSVSVAIGAISGWLLIYDATTAPADGATTPKYAIPIDSNGVNGFAMVNFDALCPLALSTGGVAVFSTTGPFVKTASATAYFSAQVI